MKLSEWANLKGVSYKTAWKLWKSGKFPEPTEQLPTGTIIILSEPKEVGVSIYARVSSNDQKADLDRQVSRLAVYAATEGLKVTAIIKETGSGLNGHRKELLKLLAGDTHILVEHRDRLCRFGFEYIEAALGAQKRRIIVADPVEIQDDVVRDLHEAIVSMCARLYGKRAAANKARKALEVIQRGELPESCDSSTSDA
jgi:predicted site-specific integrase-resolvase